MAITDNPTGSEQLELLSELCPIRSQHPQALLLGTSVGHYAHYKKGRGRVEVDCGSRSWDANEVSAASSEREWICGAGAMPLAFKLGS